MPITALRVGARPPPAPRTPSPSQAISPQSPSQSSTPKKFRIILGPRPSDIQFSTTSPNLRPRKHKAARDEEGLATLKISPTKRRRVLTTTKRTPSDPLSITGPTNSRPPKRKASLDEQDSTTTAPPTKRSRVCQATKRTSPPSPNATLKFRRAKEASQDGDHLPAAFGRPLSSRSATDLPSSQHAEESFERGVHNHAGNGSVLDAILHSNAPRAQNAGAMGREIVRHRSGPNAPGHVKLYHRGDHVVMPEAQYEKMRKTQKVKKRGCDNDTNFILRYQERQKPCSGRDELCNSVLNDEWASHPTWASEDSGFIAHKKNVHEEGLHRIEEERHDYDHNIEACSRTIQLLEPLAQQLRRLSEQEQMAYKLPPGLGGQSETIYKRIVMKLYGRDKGQEVVAQLHNRPYQVIPVLLNRLKERLETWKMAQREWEKVWREQTQKMFWKSLDHQHANSRVNDKRAFQMKTLQGEIQVKYEEMRREEKQVMGVMRKPQLEFELKDAGVIVDVAHLVLTYIDNNMSTESPRLLGWVKEFIPLFFGLDMDWFNAQVTARLSTSDTLMQDVADETPPGTEDPAPSRGRKKGNNLLRNALDRGRGKMGRKDREDSNASASRASTPEVGSAAEDEMAIDTADDSAIKREASSTRWIDHPSGGNTLGGQQVDPNESYTRNKFSLWSSTPLYCFVRMFITLYERLLRLKQGEAECRKTVDKAKTQKPAADLGIVDKLPQDFFDDVSPDANYYQQMLVKFEKMLSAEADAVDIEEVLRRFYLQTGYQLYNLEKMVQAFARFGNTILSSEGKDKSWEIYHAFKKDRVRDITSAQQQVDYRKQVEKLLKDAELYRIEFVAPDRKIRIFLTKKDDPTYDDSDSPKDREHRWRYYLATYTSTAPTHGVDASGLTRPMLLRSLRAQGADPLSTTYPPSPTGSDSAAGERIMRRFDLSRGEENLVMRIAVESYKPLWQKATQEGWFEVGEERCKGVGEVEEVADVRREAVRERLVMMHTGMRDVAREEVERRNEGFAGLVERGVEDGEGEAMEVDG